MLWEIEILPKHQDPETERVRQEYFLLSPGSPAPPIDLAARGFLLEGSLAKVQAEQLTHELLVDPLAEAGRVGELNTFAEAEPRPGLKPIATVLLKPGVMDPVAQSVEEAARDLGIELASVRTFRRYYSPRPLNNAERDILFRKVLANEAIEQVIDGPLHIDHLSLGSTYSFRLVTVPLRDKDDTELQYISRSGQLSLNLAEMKAIQEHFRGLSRDPTDVELETLAQTWSEHCSHKTLKGKIDCDGRLIDNLLKQTIFGATQEIRRRLDKDDWCVSVFEDNAGIVRFDERWNVCFKVETHNHPSAIEPYGGANTGLGGVIRDPLGTGLGARPICNTDVFCFAPPDTPPETLPAGVLHPKKVMQGVVAGVRDYGNRMGIPTVNGAVCFDPRYLGNPLVFCGTVGLIPVNRCQKEAKPGDLIVAVGGRTGRDGIHGATFSSIELTSESEKVSGGAVQIGNAITEKRMLDVILQARDLGLYHAITDCGAGGFSSAVGEMGEKLGAVVHLDRAPLKYEGLSYTEIWISEAQERMILAVPPGNWPEFQGLCQSERVEATVIGTFEATGRLRLLYHDNQVADLDMHFLHHGRPAVVRHATLARSVSEEWEHIKAKYKEGDVVAGQVVRKIQGGLLVDIGVTVFLPASQVDIRQATDIADYIGTTIECKILKIDDVRRNIVVSRRKLIEDRREEMNNKLLFEIGGRPPQPSLARRANDFNEILLKLLSLPNICSKEWIIRQYDHEVQGGTVIKPLVGVTNDGPGDAAVITPVLGSWRGLAIACGINPHYGDLDPYQMAALAIDEAVRNVVSVGADPSRVALLDNFCWGNTDRPEVLGSLVRAAEACRDVALAFNMPFISGKDSLNNEFHAGDRHIVIPPTLLISALGIVPDVRRALTMDLKEPGNLLVLIGDTRDEMGGSHYHLVTGETGGKVPQVDLARAPKLLHRLHEAMRVGLVRSCHDVSEGGLAVALAEMAFAGGIGADVTGLAELRLPDEVVCFSESATRFVLEIGPDMLEKLNSVFGHDAHVCSLGRTCKEPRLRIAGANGEWIVWAALDKLKESWQKPLRW